MPLLGEDALVLQLAESLEAREAGVLIVAE
jgi:hypothetical protein